MPRLEIQLNHGEFKLKLELQIKNGRREVVQRRSKQPWQFRKGCEFSQPTNMAAPVDFFFYSFDLFQICPYVIVFLFRYFGKLYMQYGIYARDKTL